jgi:hypothetical protein
VSRPGHAAPLPLALSEALQCLLACLPACLSVCFVAYLLAAIQQLYYQPASDGAEQGSCSFTRWVGESAGYLLARRSADVWEGGRGVLHRGDPLQRAEVVACSRSSVPLDGIYA